MKVHWTLGPSWDYSRRKTTTKRGEGGGIDRALSSKYFNGVELYKRKEGRPTHTSGSLEAMKNLYMNHMGQLKSVQRSLAMPKVSISRGLLHEKERVRGEIYSRSLCSII